VAVEKRGSKSPECEAFPRKGEGRENKGGKASIRGIIRGANCFGGGLVDSKGLQECRLNPSYLKTGEDFLNGVKKGSS